MMESDAEKTIITACASHCGGVCPLKVHIKDGVIVRVEANHELIKPCPKGRAYRQRVFAPDRLKYPLKRVGKRGSGGFERISWDEALDTITSEIKRIGKSYGPAAVGLITGGGDVGHLLHNKELFVTLLCRAGGFTGTWGMMSAEGAQFATSITYGRPGRGGGGFVVGNSPADYINSRLIILWGWDPSVTSHGGNPSLWLARAKEAGARIISIDPRYSDSAAVLSHQWIPIRPGTDGAMMVAMAYVIISEGLHDKIFLDRHTLGFGKFEDYVLGREDGIAKTPTWAEEITGVPADTIVSLAREYATTKPAALKDGIAPGRTAYGEQYHRIAIVLAAMTGNIGIAGGNAPGGVYGGPVGFGEVVGSRLKGTENPVDMKWPHRVLGKFCSLGGPSSARVNRLLFADAMLRGRSGGYPADLKMLYVVNTNYLNQHLNLNKIVQALKKLEFIVVQEQLMTPTAKFADIILPTNTYMERNDLVGGGGSLFYSFVNKAIEPLGESKSHFDIAIALAARLGINDYSDKTEDEWLREIVKKCKDIPDYDIFKTEGLHKVKLSEPLICFNKEISDPVNNPFCTPSGKIEIYSKTIDDAGDPMLPAIPKYIETWESRNDPLFRKYPLQLVTTHTRRRAHSQYDNIPWLKELYPQTISINPADARLRGIKHGDTVRVFNDRGTMIIPANITERIMPGVVDVPQGAWYNPDEKGVDHGGCGNVLSKDAPSPVGSVPTNTALVQVERWKENI